MLILLALVLLLFPAYWYLKRVKRMNQLKLNGIAGPEPHLLYGNLKEYQSMSNILCHQKWMNKYGKIVGYYLGGRPVVLVADLDLLKAIQVKDFSNFTDRFNIVKGTVVPNPVLNHRIGIVTGQRWKEIRSMLRPAFTSLKLRRNVNLMNDAIDALMDNIAKKGTTDFDIYQLYQGLAMDVIARSAFGADTNVQRDPTNDKFLTAAKTFFDVKIDGLFAWNVIFPELTWLIYPMRVLLERVKSLLNISAFNVIIEFSRNIIKQRRHDYVNSSAVGSPWKQNDLLQHMIDANMSWQRLKLAASSNLAEVLHDEGNANGIKDDDCETTKSNSTKYMSDNEIISNSFVFFEAGFETTSTTLAYTTHLLVNHQEVQDKVRQEVLDLLENEGQLDYNAVNNLPYMDAVIFETLRLFPAAAMFVTRTAIEDYHFGGMVIPKGAAIQVPVYQIHRDPEQWPDPNAFDPSRFYGANKGRENHISWQGFGVGPRNCIGMRFALLEIKLTLSKILGKYKFVATSSTEIGGLAVEYKIETMTPKHGIHVKAVPLHI